MTGGRPSEVARLLGLRPASLRLVQETSNAHWVVRDEDGSYAVLRRYRAGHTFESVAYERTVLRHLAADGWPVAAPLSDPIEVGGRWWAVYPRLGGRRHRWESTDPRHGWRGELLAELHASTTPLLRTGLPRQRDGSHRVDEASEITPEHVTLLARLRRIDRPRAVALERHARQIAEGVSFLHAARLPMTIVHGDFLPWNMHVRGSTLVGLFDFEGTRCDTRVADLAIASWGGRYPAVVDGYNATATKPLAEEEEAAMALLWRAGWLGWAWTLLARTRNRAELQELDAVLEKLARPWGE